MSDKQQYPHSFVANIYGTDIPEYPYNLISDIFITPVEPYQFKGDAEQQLELALNQLEPQEKDILIRQYRDKQSRNEIMQDLGLEKSEINSIRDKALKNLRHPNRTKLIKYGINRRYITDFLSLRLEKTKLSEQGVLWAKEVVLDYGTPNVRRVDYLAFSPAHQMSVAGIEQGTFTAYEVKSSKEDFKSGFGKNAIGDENWLVMTADTWNQIKGEYKEDSFGVLVPIPATIRLNSTAAAEWILNPEPYINDTEYHFQKVIPQHKKVTRTRSTQELLFLMLRAKH